MFRGSSHTSLRAATIAFQALTLVEKAEPLQVRFTLRLRDQRILFVDVWEHTNTKIFQISVFSAQSGLSGWSEYRLGPLWSVGWHWSSFPAWKSTTGRNDFPFPDDPLEVIVSGTCVPDEPLKLSLTTKTSWSGSTWPKSRESAGRRTDPLTPSVGRRGAPYWQFLPNGPPIPGLCLVPRSVPPGNSWFPCSFEWALASLPPPARWVVPSMFRAPLTSTDPSPWLPPGGYFLGHSCPMPCLLHRWCVPTSNVGSGGG